MLLFPEILEVLLLMVVFELLVVVFVLIVVLVVIVEFAFVVVEFPPVDVYAFDYAIISINTTTISSDIRIKDLFIYFLLPFFDEGDVPLIFFYNYI